MHALPRRGVLAAGAIAAMLVLAAFAFWTLRGDSAPPASGTPATAAAKGVPPVQNAPGLDKMAERLAARLSASGSRDGVEWELLARSYVELGRHGDAVKAFEKARRYRGDVDAQMLADYADALAVSKGRRYDAPVRDLAARALALDPANAKALELDANVAYEAGEFARAAAQWQKALAKIDPASDRGRVLAANLAQARARAAPGSAKPAPAAPSARTDPSWMPQSMRDAKAAGR